MVSFILGVCLYLSSFLMDFDWPASVERAIDPWPLEAALLRFAHQHLEF